MTATHNAAPAPQAVRSLVPARMDRLPWARFHWLVVVGLGVSWILDGIEIQLISASGYKDSLGMSSAEVGFAGTIYLIGQVVGALVFGRLTDRWGRKRLFITTLAVYLVASGVAGLAWTPWFLYVWRFVAGMGIGGEYAAINSAVDELIPARYRGRVDIAINGTYWAGAMIGAVGSVFLLDHSLVPEAIGWRIAFFIGPLLGLVIIRLRRHIPESPRWMVTHGLEEEAERIVDDIEAGVRAQGKPLEPVDRRRAMCVIPEDSVSFAQMAEVFFRQYPSRTFLGVTMMITQSFLYNAIFFTYALVLQNFYHLDPSQTALYFFPFAAGNLLGPLLLGPLFDTVGRRRMIFGTYLLSGTVLLVSAVLFRQGVLTANTHTVFWCVSFFFASAGASSAYLTVSEIFPLEVRAQAISYFFAVGQVVGSVGPLLFGWLVGTGSEREPLFWGYVLGAVVMMFGGVVALVYGVDAEGRGLEEIAEPLTKAGRERGFEEEEAAETV
ncbi:MFS transporter [Azospirillum picis]|uniref:MFS family permease n=1 Tax=Azospirillum picis TaxID=488438 RepID=A0ABU0MJI6_9PROT|nr:MFS transporter [Azospirillum picis]MBP2299730.1 MFS family permease [Azospirillum picis]MDQ0533526.1 MFS family permease [Azospirillum picis]